MQYRDKYGKILAKLKNFHCEFLTLKSLGAPNNKVTADEKLCFSVPISLILSEDGARVHFVH